MNRKSKELALLMVLLSIIALAGSNFVPPDDKEAESSCKVNLVNLAVAMEFYSTYHKGRYPESLEQLHPDYIQALPKCPPGGTYLLQTGPQALGNESGWKDYYILICPSEHHPDPLAYSGIKGIANPEELLLP